MKVIKIISLLFTLNVLLSASEYYAKIEPFETYNVKSAVSGQVVYVNDVIESTTVNNQFIIKLDSKVDMVDLEQTNNKINSMSQIIKIEKSTLKKFNKISSKSQLDKDNQKIKILNLENQKSDLIVKKATLKDKIKNKNIKEDGKYISNINVKIGDFINAGTLVYTAVDLSKGKLEIFIPISEAKDYKLKAIYIDGIKTNYKISKLYKVADTKHISSYKCEIVIDAPKSFSKLVKIEFK